MSWLKNTLNAELGNQLESRQMLAATVTTADNGNTIISEGEVTATLKADDKLTGDFRDKTVNGIVSAVEWWNKYITQGSYKVKIRMKDLTGEGVAGAADSGKGMTDRTGSVFLDPGMIKQKQGFQVRRIVAHEMGHNLGLSHNTGGIMGTGGTKESIEKIFDKGPTKKQLRKLEKVGLRAETVETQDAAEPAPAAEPTAG